MKKIIFCLFLINAFSLYASNSGGNTTAVVKAFLEKGCRSGNYDEVFILFGNQSDLNRCNRLNDSNLIYSYRINNMGCISRKRYDPFDAKGLCKKLAGFDKN